MTADPVLLRPAGPDDAAAVADVWLRSFDAALPTVRRAHPDDDVRRWIRDVIVPRDGTWVAETGGAVVGVLALAGGWVDQLYLDPEFRGRGIGDRFVALAERSIGKVKIVTSGAGAARRSCSPPGSRSTPSPWRASRRGRRR